MGMEKYEEFVKRAHATLTYPPGWSRDNKTGAWRTVRPVHDAEKCNDCALCWVYCPDGAIARLGYAIDYDYCKGCGICAEACKVGAIAMAKETGS